MGQRIEEYWERVNKTNEKLIAGLPPGAPEEVFIMSIDNYDKGTNAGHVTSCNTKLAAQRMTESTHRLASDDEIKAFLKARDGRFEESNDRDARRKAENQPVIVVDSGNQASRLAPQQAASVIRKAAATGERAKPQAS